MLEVNEERGSPIGGKLRVRLDSIPKMVAVCVRVGAKKPATDSNLGSLNWVNLKRQVALRKGMQKALLGVI